MCYLFPGQCTDWVGLRSWQWWRGDHPKEGNRLKQRIANLSPAQQMTVLEILRENKEKLDQDEEGNVEMEFRDFTQKSINDLQAYVNSVTNPPPSQNQEKNSDDDEED